MLKPVAKASAALMATGLALLLCCAAPVAAALGLGSAAMVLFGAFDVVAALLLVTGLGLLGLSLFKRRRRALTARAAPGARAGSKAPSEGCSVSCATRRGAG